MKPKSAVVFIGKAGVRTVRMQALHQPINETKSLVAPFVQLAAEKIVFGELRPSGLSGWQGGGGRINSFGDRIQ